MDGYVVEVPVGVDGYKIIDYKDTYGEAEAECAKWSKNHPDVLRITKVPYEVKVRVRGSHQSIDRPRENRTPEIPMPSGIKPEIGERKNAVPKSKPDKSNPDSIAGKRATGTFGKFKLTISFGDDGTVTFTEAGRDQKQVALGEWTQTGKAVTIDTPTFLYMGLINGNQIAGKRVAKQTDSPLSEMWQAAFDVVVPKDERAISGLSAKDVVGRWTRAYQADGTPYYEIVDIRPNGIMNLEWGDTKYGQYVGAKGTYYWELDGSKVVFKQKDMTKGSWDKRFERTIDYLRKEYKR